VLRVGERDLAHDRAADVRKRGRLVVVEDDEAYTDLVASSASLLSEADVGERRLKCASASRRSAPTSPTRSANTQTTSVRNCRAMPSTKLIVAPRASVACGGPVLSSRHREHLMNVDVFVRTPFA
jgi:hypothetical protein